MRTKKVGGLLLSLKKSVHRPDHYSLVYFSRGRYRIFCWSSSSTFPSYPRIETTSFDGHFPSVNGPEPTGFDLGPSWTHTDTTAHQTRQQHHSGGSSQQQPKKRFVGGHHGIPLDFSLFSTLFQRGICCVLCLAHDFLVYVFSSSSSSFSFHPVSSQFPSWRRRRAAL